MTGAGSGIGRALACELGRRGFLVTATDIDGSSAEATAALIGPFSRHASLDVRDAEAVAACVRHIVEESGHLDMLVNNAGIPISGEVQDLTLAHWDRIIDINLRGVVHGVAAAYPAMQRRGSGTIVNVSSIAGLSLGPLGTPYAATKHAVVGLSLSLRAEAVAYGVNVSVLCPGAVETPILDRDNPSDLPSVPWRPDNRSYLTRLCGAPMPVDVFARQALDAVERGEGVVVRPFLARVAWWTQRFMPVLARMRVRMVLAEQRAAAANGTSGPPPTALRATRSDPPRESRLIPPPEGTNDLTGVGRQAVG
ncbi:MAG: SDR family oxidoreductase [Methylobacterium sp.]|uniref:SDR family oxidoreductase n=1 Tax=Methylobacterium sp. TaxID=409 RepID=UPI0026001922|nr:SDR family oxidoreductase [Methylobacterium sp.]MBX9930588.1 SDR family oxidoreductase [Methylobacterium sp.]